MGREYGLVRGVQTIWDAEGSGLNPRPCADRPYPTRLSRTCAQAVSKPVGGLVLGELVLRQRGPERQDCGRIDRIHVRTIPVIKTESSVEHPLCGRVSGHATN